MTFADLITEEAIAFPAEPADLNAVLRDLVARVGSRVGREGEKGQKLARDLAFGSAGEIVRVNDSLVLVLGRVEEAREAAAAVAVSGRPFAMSGEGSEPRGQARGVLLLLTPWNLGTLRERFVPGVIRALRDEERTALLLRATTPADVLGIDDLMQVQLRKEQLVEDALTPLRYRIYPDTPLDEVVGLMVRRGLRAVPVVGENLEVLGIISIGDVLRHLLPGRRGPDDDEASERHEGRPEATARDVMTRTVMCVSEDQSLLEVANLMVNRDVDQLPVVRKGEFIGFLTRDAILSRLFGE